MAWDAANVCYSTYKGEGQKGEELWLQAGACGDGYHFGVARSTVDVPQRIRLSLGEATDLHRSLGSFLHEVEVERFVLMFARGLVDLYERVVVKGGIVQDDDSQGEAMQQARNLLVRLCLKAGAPDLGASLHNLLHLATKRMDAWGVEAVGCVEYFDAVLIRDNAPTPLCRALAEKPLPPTAISSRWAKNRDPRFG